MRVYIIYILYIYNIYIYTIYIYISNQRGQPKVNPSWVSITNSWETKKKITGHEAY